MEYGEQPDNVHLYQTYLLCFRATSASSKLRIITRVLWRHALQEVEESGVKKRERKTTELGGKL